MEQFNMKQQHLGYILPSIGCSIQQLERNIAGRWYFYLINPQIENFLPRLRNKYCSIKLFMQITRLLGYHLLNTLY